MFKELEKNPNFPEIEKEIENHWESNDIFNKSVNSKSENNKWTFLDGPPFITGLPHYGSLLSSIPKDVFPRFWTMKGYRVRRVWGWDCHGLPAENKVENKLKISRKKDIEEKVGIKKFIDECKLYVKDVSSEWEWYIKRIGRWVDFKNAYKTMDLTYMETVMWVFKQIYENGYIYKGMRISLYCPHCSTPISNFEVAMDNENYKEITEPASIYKFKLVNEENTYLLAWSTTPWNKIVTTALAVNETFDYVKVKNEDEYYILAESTLPILKNTYEIVERFKGKKLIGKEYEPYYSFFDIEKGKKAFVVISGDFVTSDEGTGIVTIAPYGEEDLEIMKKENIQIVLHVDDEGNILKNVPLFGGMYYLKANKYVNEDLKKRGLLYHEESYKHSMPHCWRCGTQLFYAPQDAWYIDVQKLKPQLIKTNKKINWHPKHFKYGRFLKSMESAPDWCISRSRYWGSPVPVWECSCGWKFVPGSINELEEKSKTNIKDLHRPDIDNVVIKCDKCGKKAKRVSEVLDSWIEAGSASYAERHYPFEDDIQLDNFFPPDFIAEYTGQIRAWFYVLHVISNAIFNTHAYKNVLVTGVILGSDGRKMSKNYGNYPDPKMMLNKYGGDALRLYLLGSSVMKGEDILISENEYKNQIKLFHIPFWNIFSFFFLYTSLYKVSEKDLKEYDNESDNILDIWATELLDDLKKKVTYNLESYDTMSAIKNIIIFVDDISKWYVRRSRERAIPENNKKDFMSFYSTLYNILKDLCLVTAPIAPFISEKLFKHLTHEESVHLKEWPGIKKTIDDQVLEDMNVVRKMAEIGHKKRKDSKIKVRQPLAKVVFNIPDTMDFKRGKYNDQYKKILSEELNVKDIIIKISKDNKDIDAEYDLTITKELEEEGLAREIIREVQKLRKKLGLNQNDRIHATLEDYPQRFEKHIKEKIKAVTLKKGEKMSIEQIHEKK